jgi:16S rRNA C967 or C1407 C5-methylase (RsmB/RsmF family)
MRARYGVLRSNVETWGDLRVGTVSRDPSAFGNTPLFDVIVADVPCSGEGMFRKDAQAVAEWSPQTVEFCAARSRRILRDIWGTLKRGGYLIYSTCTFNHLENDDTVAWAAEELGADIVPILADASPAIPTRCGYALLPGLQLPKGHIVPGGVQAGDTEPVRPGHRTQFPGPHEPGLWVAGAPRPRD